jgi:predicted glycosyltransferase
MELGVRNDEGLKWTKDAKEQWLLSTDARYIVLSEEAQEAERLLYTLRDLANIIFTRDKKLEQLSINYRRETEIDKRTS